MQLFGFLKCRWFFHFFFFFFHYYLFRFFFLFWILYFFKWFFFWFGFVNFLFAPLLAKKRKWIYVFFFFFCIRFLRFFWVWLSKCQIRKYFSLSLSVLLRIVHFMRDVRTSVQIYTTTRDTKERKGKNSEISFVFLYFLFVEWKTMGLVNERVTQCCGCDKLRPSKSFDKPKYTKKNLNWAFQMFENIIS